MTIFICINIEEAYRKYRLEVENMAEEPDKLGILTSMTKIINSSRNG